MCNYMQLWGFGVSYMTSDAAPVVATTVAVLVLVLVAAVVVLGFIAALLLAALVLGFTATAAAAVAASALVAAAAPAALDTATGLEVQVDAPGAAGVVVKGAAREPQPFLYAAVLVPHKEPAVVHLAHLARRRRLLVRGSFISRRDDNHRNPLAVLLWDAAVLLWLLDQDQHLEAAAHFHRRGLIRLAQSAGVVPGYLSGLSRSRLLCLQLSSHRLNRQRSECFEALRCRIGDSAFSSANICFTQRARSATVPTVLPVELGHAVSNRVHP